MTRIEWGGSIPRFDQGVDSGVLYLPSGAVAWNGLIKVIENDSAEVKTSYFDGQKVRVVENLGFFGAEVEAFAYPDEFETYVGSDLYLTGQSRKRFNLSYRTGDVDNRKIHLVWNAVVLPAEFSHSSHSKQANADTFQWVLTTKPVGILGSSPGSHLVVDLSDPRYLEAWAELEPILYGSVGVDARLPDPGEIAEIFEAHTEFTVTQNMDGTWTAVGPDGWITVNGDGTYEISSPSAHPLSEHTHQTTSY